MNSLEEEEKDRVVKKLPIRNLVANIPLFISATFEEFSPGDLDHN